MSAATLDRAGGQVIARGEDYRQTFQHFRPGFDLAAERLRREEADFAEHFDEGDLYPDARPCLEKLKQLGFLIGAAGNQAAQAERRLRALGLPLALHRNLGGVGSREAISGVLCQDRCRVWPCAS
jgi:FMN phosphatase YigB (HAD superfamily)